MTMDSLQNHSLANVSTVSFTNLLVSQRSAWLGLMIGLCIFGTCNNSLLLTIILKDKKLRVGSGFLAAHLVAVCLLACSIGIPSSVAVMVFGLLNIPLPKFTCQVTYFLYLSVIFAGHWADAVLAINRFVAVWFPHCYRNLTTKKVTGFLIVLCWIASFGYTLPLVIGVVGDFKLSSSGLCLHVAATNDTTRIHAQTILTAFAYVPFAFIGAGSLGILLRLVVMNVFHTHRTIASLNQSKTMQRRLDNARMLLVSFVWSCLCYFPTPIIGTFYPTVYLQKPTLSMWLRVCIAGQYALNPIIFYALSVDYRSSLKRILKNRIGNSVSPVGTIYDDNKKITET